MLTETERATLARIAWTAVTDAANGRPATVPPAAGVPAGLTRAQGVFVSLHAGDTLRGCLGFVESVRPLFLATAEMAHAAASRDHRFPPVAARELAGLSVEISVLSPPEPVTAREDVAVGTHGLIARSGARTGLLLPQVPVEWGWDRDAFVAHTLMKAGLPPNTPWANVTFLRFTAEVFPAPRPPAAD